ncbi:DUF397 domain-containing protein [Nonomuraea sp. NPDC005650]|uniref:DUF397 domain-containing protein n=1 Tax=Nonomuraea sp. NPDC005650 TaxID=3157045 RepID=UPI0033A7FB6D
MSASPASVDWRKSKYCPNGRNCVEVASLPGARVAIRNSTLGDQSPMLDIQDWHEFLAKIAGRVEVGH